MGYDMRKFTDVEMAEQILNVLVLDIDYGDSDDDLPSMIQQFADRVGERDPEGLTEIEQKIHGFCSAYQTQYTLRVMFGNEAAKAQLTQDIQDWINDELE
jgi:hypothetical protein